MSEADGGVESLVKGQCEESEGRHIVIRSGLFSLSSCQCMNINTEDCQLVSKVSRKHKVLLETTNRWTVCLPRAHSLISIASV